MKKIVFTGGHHNSALAVAKKIKQQKIAEIVWFGHRYTILGDKNESAEYQEVTQSGIKFYNLVAGKVHGKFNPLKDTFEPIQFARLVWGFIQALIYIFREKPDLVVSFGGYLAVPVVFWAWVFRIPAVTHEQTTVIGKANRIIARLAKKIFVTWPQSKQYLPAQKVVITGLPLRQTIFKHRDDSNLDRAGFDDKLPTIYITGGKQGSHIINQTVALALPDLLQRANIIHQVGSTSQADDYEHLTQAAESLPHELRGRYVLKKYVYENEIGTVFHLADFVISRAGAHIVYELAALGKPALFIPIPWVSYNEQHKNARLLVNAGSALTLSEDRLNKQSLLENIDKMIQDLDHYRKKGAGVKNQIVLNAVERIVDEIEEILKA